MNTQDRLKNAITATEIMLQRKNTGVDKGYLAKILELLKDIQNPNRYEETLPDYLKDFKEET